MVPDGEFRRASFGEVLLERIDGYGAGRAFGRLKVDGSAKVRP